MQSPHRHRSLSVPEVTGPSTGFQLCSPLCAGTGPHGPGEVGYVSGGAASEGVKRWMDPPPPSPECQCVSSASLPGHAFPPPCSRPSPRTAPSYSGYCV